MSEKSRLSKREKEYVHFEKPAKLLAVQPNDLNHFDDNFLPQYVLAAIVNPKDVHKGFIRCLDTRVIFKVPPTLGIHRSRALDVNYKTIRRIYTLETKKQIAVLGYLNEEDYDRKYFASLLFRNQTDRDTFLDRYTLNFDGNVQQRGDLNNTEFRRSRVSLRDPSIYDFDEDDFMVQVERRHFEPANKKYFPRRLPAELMSSLDETRLNTPEELVSTNTGALFRELGQPSNVNKVIANNQVHKVSVFPNDNRHFVYSVTDKYGMPSSHELVRMPNKESYDILMKSFEEKKLAREIYGSPDKRSNGDLDSVYGISSSKSNGTFEGNQYAVQTMEFGMAYFDSFPKKISDEVITAMREERFNEDKKLSFTRQNLVFKDQGNFPDKTIPYDTIECLYTFPRDDKYSVLAVNNRTGQPDFYYLMRGNQRDQDKLLKEFMNNGVLMYSYENRPVSKNQIYPSKEENDVYDTRNYNNDTNLITNQIYPSEERSTVYASMDTSNYKDDKNSIRFSKPDSKMRGFVYSDSRGTFERPLAEPDITTKPLVDDFKRKMLQFTDSKENWYTDVAFFNDSPTDAFSAPGNGSIYMFAAHKESSR